MAAVFPIHYARELLRAFEIQPMEVWGPPGIGLSKGAARLQPYVCTIVQNALAFVESGNLDAVDLLLVPHACDSLQGLGSILTDFVKPRQPVLTLYMPRGQRDSDVDFLADELRALYHRLEAITGRAPSDRELMDAIRREEAADALLTELHRNRPNLPFTDEAFYRLVRSREYLPTEQFIEIAQQCRAGFQTRQPGRDVNPALRGIPLLLSGILPEPMSLFPALAEMGATVAADDLACCGRRLYPAGKSEEPFQRMAERLLGAAPDAMRGSPIQRRLDHLRELVQGSGARGVVFYDVKFCEPELFDLPLLRQGLSAAGIPSLALEVDLNDGLSQPMLNRLEAFLEMLK